MAKLKKRKIKVKARKIIKPAKRRKVLVRKKIQKPKIKKIKSRKNIRPKIKKTKKAKKFIYQFARIGKSKKTVKKKNVHKRPVAKKTVRKIKRAPKKAIRKKIVKRTVQRIAKKKPAVRKFIKARLKPKAVKRHIVKKTKQEPQKQFAAEALFKAKIKVIGIGGGGGSIVSEIGRSLEKATFVIADTDIRALKKRSGIKYFWFGEELTHGLGTGVNVDLAKQAAESAKEKISDFFKDQDIIIFVASLGGGLGSGATQVFAEAAKEFGGITFGIFTMPFKFEGKNKQNTAQRALKSLRQSLNVSLVIPNEKIFKIIDASTPITNAFSTVNKSLIESLESLIDLIYNPGVINIDFADLRTILKGRGNSAFLNTVEESGKERVEKVCENIFKNPLLQTNSFKAEKILFNIAGSESLSMFEVEKISSHIADLNPKAKIIFGISKDSKLKNKIKTTILMTGGAPGVQIKEPVVKKSEPVKAVVVPETKAADITEKTKRFEPHAKKKKTKSGKPVKKKKDKTSPGTEVAPKATPPVSFIPVFEAPAVPVPILEQRRIDIIQTPNDTQKDVPAGRQAMPIGRQAIRRSGLEIKKAEELQEKKRIAQEKEWETPAFLRKLKIKS